MKTQPVNYKKATRITKRMAADRMPIRNSGSGAWLYHYNGQWFCIIDGVFVKRREGAMITSDIEKHPGAVVTICTAPDQTVTIPDVVAGHKNIVGAIIANDAELVERMSEDTGIEVAVEDLQPKPILPGYTNKHIKPVVFARVASIIDKIRGVKPTAKPRIFCAGDYPMTSKQHAFSLKVRAIIQKMKY